MVTRTTHVPRLGRRATGHFVVPLCGAEVPGTLRGSMRRTLAFISGFNSGMSLVECDACSLMHAALKSNFNIDVLYSPFRTLMVQQQEAWAGPGSDGDVIDVDCITLGGYFAVLHVLRQFATDVEEASTMARWEVAGSFEHMQRVASFAAPAGCKHCGAPANAFHSGTPSARATCLVCFG